MFLLLQSFSINVIFSYSCFRKFTNRPLNGYHCITEYYANTTSIPRHRCTNLCTQDPQCRVLSYNPVTQSCLMGAEPCKAAEASAHSSLMVFREMEDESCVSWTPLLNDQPRLVGTGPHHARQAAVGRMGIGQNTYLGHINLPERKGYFTIDNSEVPEPTNFEVLSVSPSCSLAWMPYTTGDTVPAAALKLGYVTGVGHTYSIRVQRPDLNTDKFGVYAAGDAAAYYPFHGVISATEVDILVQV